MKFWGKTFAWFPSPSPHLKKRVRKRQIFSVISQPKLYLSAYIKRNKPVSLPTSLSSFYSLVGVIMRRKVFKREKQKKSPCPKWTTTWSSALGPEKGEQVPSRLELQVVAQCGKTGPEKLKLQRNPHPNNTLDSN